MPTLEERLKAHARYLGFDLAGIARAEPADDFTAFQGWLDRGYAATMHYLQRGAEARRQPQSILPAVRSIVMLGANYKPPDDEDAAASGRVARYARGDDYHRVLWDKLHLLLAWVQEQVPQARGRGVVDTAPLLERGLARRAGLGWFGKNTMLLNKKLGSYFFIAALLLDVDLTPDEPFTLAHCGTCTACLDACPTDAFPAPYQLDARRCISYLTIEHRGPISPELRTGIGDWLFGCDICQEVCPWNRKAPATREPSLLPDPGRNPPDALAWLSMSEAEYRSLFKGSALTRAKRTGLRRNAALVLGNVGDEAALPSLETAAADEDPTVREAALWAIEQVQKKRRKDPHPGSTQ